MDAKMMLNSSNTSSSAGDGTLHGRLPLALSSNDQMPEFLYKQLPVTCLPIGAALNILLVYYIIRSKKYKSPLFTFIASLALNDFMSCIGVVGWAGLLYPTITAAYPTLTCKLVMLIGGSGLSGSAYHLTFFSCLRYYQLCYPLHARAKVTVGFVFKLCIGIWIGSVLAWTIIAIFYYSIDVVYNGEVLQLCGFSGSVVVREWCYLVLDTIVPCCIILIMHLLKYTQLFCQTQNNKHIAGKQQERHNAAARAVAIVIILFIIAWCPVNIYAVLHTYGPNEGTYQDKLFLALGYMIAYNSALNPIVYVIAVKSIRNDIQIFLCSGLKLNLLR